MPMMFSNYVFKTDLRFQDFLELNWLVVKKSMILLVLAIDAFFCYSIFNTVGRNLAILAAIFVVLFIAIYYMEYFFIRWRSKKVFNATTVSREITITLSDTGIVQVSRKGENELSWENVFRVNATKNCYYVFLNKKQAFYFPKRSFKDKDDEKLFCDFIIDKVDPVKVRF